MDWEKRLIVIFFVLWFTAGIVVGATIYFNARKKTDSVLSESTATTVQTPSSQGELTTIETIPTSTIITAPTSTATPPPNLLLPYTLGAHTATTTYWPKGWGNISFNNNDLTLIPDPATHGANSFLTGASSWSNYSVNADASWLMGGWFDIVARVSDNTQDFVYCEFGSNGTEIIERVNGKDTQIALAVASTTAIQGATENFGMKVYGNDIACMMANQEVLGAQVPSDETPTGGVGVVIFGQPAQQKGVVISNLSVSPLNTNDIVTPFPVVTAAPTSTSPSQSPSSSSVVAPTSTPATATTPTPALSLPYSTSLFDPSDWYQGWGYFSTASGTLAVGSNGSITSGGIFLAGSDSWTDYKFTAYVEWISGQVFELVARRTDGNNLLECIYDEADAADTTVSINMISNGQTTALTQGQTFLDNSAHMTATGFEVSMTVQGSNVQCEMDNQSVYGTIPNGLLTQGGIGFITWDSQQDNSQINVTKISVTPL